MTDVLVGVTLPQFTDDRARFADGAQRAEALGFDSIWLFDHLWPLSGNKDRPILEAWTSLAWIAEATERVAIGTLVTRSSLRNPALLVHMAKTVAAIAPRRLIIGIGSGDHMSRAENEAFGIPYWAGADRLAQFEEVLALLRTELAASGVQLWVAGRSDDALDLAARYGDAWNGWGGNPDSFARDATTVVSYAGERPVELTWGGVMKEQTPEAAAEELSGFVRAGARHLVCTYARAWRSGVYETLAEEIRPRIHRDQRSVS
ncbi:MAG: LLM class flavin-dependent oxidoreductase [Actinomycetota bacterium]|nr:LLM class flavin-dependent oxidoreductase [Actinomycetota bacterium]